MNKEQFKQLEKDLWSAADNLRVASGLFIFRSKIIKMGYEAFN